MSDKFHLSINKPLLGFHKEISTVSPSTGDSPVSGWFCTADLEVSQPRRVVGTVPEQLHILYRHRRRKSSTSSSVWFYIFNFHLFGCTSMFHVPTILPRVALLCFSHGKESGSEFARFIRCFVCLGYLACVDQWTTMNSNLVKCRWSSV